MFISIENKTSNCFIDSDNLELFDNMKLSSYRKVVSYDKESFVKKGGYYYSDSVVFKKKESIKKILLNFDPEKIIEINPFLIKFIDNQSESLQLKVVNDSRCIYYNMLKYLKNPTEKVIFDAIKLDPFCISCISNLSNKMIETVLKINGNCIKFIKNQNERYCLMAIKNNFRSISHMNNLTPKIIFNAIKQNRLAIDYLPEGEFQKLSKKEKEKCFLEMVKQNGMDINIIINPSKKVIEEAIKQNPKVKNLF